MSLILDALNKAQRERQEQQEPVPQLSTVHYTPSAGTDNPAHVRKGAIAGGVLVLCLAAFLGGRWLSVGAPVAEEIAVEASLEQPQAASAAQPSSTRREMTAAEPARQAPVAPVRPASPASTAPQDVTQLYQQPEAPQRRPAVRDGAKVEVKNAPAAQATVSANAQSALQRAASEAAVVSEPKSKPENVVAQPAAHPSDSIAALTDLPYVQDLSWATQQNLPSIIYADHRYQENPAGRSVLINGNTYRKGGQIEQGLVLEDIFRDGIVLQFQGQRFKLQALNSWVNF
jgi:general secretion pathway protein B